MTAGAIQNNIELVVKADDLYVKGVESYNAGDYNKAIELFRDSATREKRAYFGLGHAYYKSGNPDSAIDALEEGLKYTEDFNARKLLSFILYEKGDLKKSIEHAQKALSLRQDDQLKTLYDKATKEDTAQDGFLSESSGHFKILFEGRSHGNISRKALDFLEDAYAEIGRDLNLFPTETVTVVLYTEKAFFDVTEVPGWSGGAYDGKISIPIMGAEKDPRLLRQILFHEYTHALVFQVTKNCPVWFNEGLAVYYSGGLEKTEQVMSLRTLQGSFMNMSREQATTAYRVSYSAVAYLMEKYGPLSVKYVLIGLKEGKTLNEAFMSAFSISYDDFLRDWGRD